jgi:hypothetical protein
MLRNIKHIIFKDSIPNSRTYCFSITKIIWLIILRKFTVYSENHTKQIIKTTCWQNSEVVPTKQDVYTIASVLQRIILTVLQTRTFHSGIYSERVAGFFKARYIIKEHFRSLFVSSYRISNLEHSFQWNVVGRFWILEFSLKNMKA